MIYFNQCYMMIDWLKKKKIYVPEKNKLNFTQWNLVQSLSLIWWWGPPIFVEFSLI